MEQQDSAPTPKHQKSIMLTIFASFTMLVLMLVFVSMTIQRRPSLDAQGLPAPLVYGIGITALVTAIAFATTRLRVSTMLGDDTPIQAPRVFQTGFVVSLAMAELAALLGFVGAASGGPPMWPLAAGTLAVYFFVILPRVLTYWRVFEERDGYLASPNAEG